MEIVDTVMFACSDYALRFDANTEILLQEASTDSTYNSSTSCSATRSVDEYSYYSLVGEGQVAAHITELLIVDVRGMVSLAVVYLTILIQINPEQLAREE